MKIKILDSRSTGGPLVKARFVCPLWSELSIYHRGHDRTDRGVGVTDDVGDGVGDGWADDGVVVGVGDSVVVGVSVGDGWGDVVVVGA